MSESPPKNRWREVCEQFHEYVLFMGNTGLRPDESAQLQYRDVTIIKDEGSGQRILEIEARGNCGVDYCKGMPGAVLPYERVSKLKQLKPTDCLFGNTTRELTNTVPE